MKGREERARRSQASLWKEEAEIERHIMLWELLCRVGAGCPGSPVEVRRSVMTQDERGGPREGRDRGQKGMIESKKREGRGCVLLNSCLDELFRFPLLLCKPSR